MMKQSATASLAQHGAMHPELLESEAHICAFFRDEAEEFQVITPFLKEGFARSERVFMLADPTRRDAHIRRLRDAGIDVDAARERGQLVVLSWEQTYLEGGYFDLQRTMGQLKSARDDGRRRGFPRTRFFCHMEWALDAITTEKLAEYEATSNFAPMDGDIAICAYQMPRWGGQMLVSALRSHQMVILGGLLHQNPYYLPPAEALAEIKGSRLAACC